MAIQGFNKEFYLNAKLAQLQSDAATAADWAGKDAAFLEQRLETGFGLTAEQHYEQFGYKEDLAPNEFFNPAEYIRAKAVALFNDPATSYLSVDAAAEDFVNLWGGNVYNHYLQFGEEEGINPSNAFDVSSYLEAKLVQLQTDEATAAEWADKGVSDVAAAFEAAGVTALEHFLAFGQEEGLSAPAVPAEEQVNPDTSVPGQSFTLSKGLDNIVGTADDDTIVGSIDDGNAELNTLSNIDVIDGGAGTDTLKVNHASGDVTLGNLSNVEVVEVSSAAGEGVSVDSSDIAGITDLNLVKAAGKIDLTAAAETNVDVASKGHAVDVTGGKDVTINLTDADSGDNVTVDGAPKGDVNVTATGVAAANGSNVTMGNITVTGGSTINVTQQATSSTAALVAGNTVVTHTQGDVTINAVASTTDVTVKQDAAVAAESEKAVAGATEVASVKFTSVDEGDTVTVGGLTFTAGKDLTAAEVAQAFANLTADAVTPTDADDATAKGDTQGSSVAANGTFTGSLIADWSSAAASGDTVVFTAKANTAIANLEATNATVTTTTQGVDAVSAENTAGVVAGDVDITGAAALETVTVDSYGGSSSITGDSNAALETISLANGGDFTIASAATTLGLTLNNVDGTVNVAAGTETLNASITGEDTDTVTLQSASAEAVNVSGTGNVAGTTTGLSAATAIDTSGMTAGTATFTIVDGTETSYTGGAGKDAVTISNANIAITQAVALGAGDDTLTLNAAADTVAVPTATLQGGEGTDTIALNGESAAALSANGNFAGKIDGFEKLAITDKVAAARTVNMANMDGIAYVVSNNAANAVTAATNTTFTVDLTGTTLLSAEDSLAFNGATLTGAEYSTASSVALALAGLSYTDWNVQSVSGATITFEAKVAGPGQTVPAEPVFTLTDADTSSTVAQDISSSTLGAAESTAAALTLDNMADDSTLELVGSGDGVVVTMDDATGNDDSFNIVTKVDNTGLNFGTVDVAGVESLTLNAMDTSPVDTTTGEATITTGSLTLKADAATSLTVEGNSNVSLSLHEDTDQLATINGASMTGNLTASANGAVAMTITGGAGDDTLTASTGADAKADVLVGGAGDDVLYAGSNGAKLTGGEGNDLFVLTADAANAGSKDANAYSEITDFAAGDLLQLQAFTSGATDEVGGFAKLAATLDEGTAVFSDFVNAAILEAAAGNAVWFNFQDSAYVAVDNGDETTSFANGEDMVIKLTGVDGNDLSWNADFATVALA
ncbi:beta strand repeat-containing protein [Vreelandella venusta]|uniref:beta strand repeat-containing protein n=1 Tax=Vreelandella venusta TaxID=44935 RepID=UPI00384BB4D2